MMIMQRTILDFTKIGFSHGLRYNEIDDMNEVISEIKKCILDNLLPAIDLNAKTRYIWHADYNPVDLDEIDTTLKIEVVEIDGKEHIDITIWYPGIYYDCGDIDNDIEAYEEIQEVHKLIYAMFLEINAEMNEMIAQKGNNMKIVDNRKDFVDYILNECHKYAGNKLGFIFFRDLFIRDMSRKDFIEAYDEILQKTNGDHLVRVTPTPQVLETRENLTLCKDNDIRYTGYSDLILFHINSEARNAGNGHDYYIRVTPEGEYLDFVVGGGKAGTPYDPFVGIVIDK